MIYANVERVYSIGGERNTCLFDAVKASKFLTVNRMFSCGGPNGTWQDVPFKEVQNHPSDIAPAIRSLTTGIDRTLTPEEAVPLLFSAVKQSIARSWHHNVFHIVFASSGYDSRIIQACVWQLMQERGGSWLGDGLLFLSNRWEAKQFTQIMQAQGWDSKHYACYTDGQDEEHFGRGLRDVWRAAPLPIPGNLWWYLPSWAEEQGMILGGAFTQAYTGLWANEAWNAFLSADNPWIGYVNTWYGYNCMASLPVRTHFVEYPMVDLAVLDILARTQPCSGDALRRQVAEYGGGEKIAAIERLSLDDRKHRLSDRLRAQLDSQYKATWLGAQWPWVCPTDSEFSTEWGKFSVAMLVEELRKVGVNVRF